MTNPKLEVVAETVFDCSFLDGGVESTLFELPNQGQIAYNGVLLDGPFDRDLSFLDQVPEHERHAVFGILNNRDITSQVYPVPRRVVIDTWNVLVRAGLASAPDHVQEEFLASNLPYLMAVLRETVYPFRSKLRCKSDKWFCFRGNRKGLRKAIAGLNHVWVLGRVCKHVTITKIQAVDRVFDSGVHVFPTESCAVFGVFQSKIFEVLTRRLGSSLNATLRIIGNEVFPQFPSPWGNWTPTKEIENRMVPISARILGLREQMLKISRSPTVLYNAFDNPGDKRPAIQALREAHMALEAAVLAEYGWSDLAGPERWVFDRPWIDGTWRFVPNAETRREYLRRLERLNHERAAHCSGVLR